MNLLNKDTLIVQRRSPLLGLLFRNRSKSAHYISTAKSTGDTCRISNIIPTASTTFSNRARPSWHIHHLQNHRKAASGTFFTRIPLTVKPTHQGYLYELDDRTTAPPITALALYTCPDICHR